MKFLRPILLFVAVALFAVAVEKAAERPANPLVWDALEKSFTAKPDEMEAKFVFNVTNTSKKPITIITVRPSCGCTVVETPADPWIIAPGASAALPAVVDITGKDGTLTKSIFINSSAGQQILSLHIQAPPMDLNVRAKNQETARADRQSIFRGSCVQCHVIPTMGKTGEDLFKSACLICHTPEGRASMVPSLLEARTHRDAAWWRTWISEGKEGTLMPAFAKPRGILTEEEITSLVEFALSHLPTEPKAN